MLSRIDPVVKFRKCFPPLTCRVKRDLENWNAQRFTFQPICLEDNFGLCQAFLTQKFSENVSSGISIYKRSCVRHQAKIQDWLEGKNLSKMAHTILFRE